MKFRGNSSFIGKSWQRAHPRRLGPYLSLTRAEHWGENIMKGTRSKGVIAPIFLIALLCPVRRCKSLNSYVIKYMVRFHSINNAMNTTTVNSSLPKSWTRRKYTLRRLSKTNLLKKILSAPSPTTVKPEFQSEHKPLFTKNYQLSLQKLIMEQDG